MHVVEVLILHGEFAKDKAMHDVTPMHLQSLTSDSSIAHRHLTEAGAQRE